MAGSWRADRETYGGESLMSLTPEQIHFFRHNGFLKLPATLPVETVRRLHAQRGQAFRSGRPRAWAGAQRAYRPPEPRGLGPGGASLGNRGTSPPILTCRTEEPGTT